MIIREFYAQHLLLMLAQNPSLGEVPTAWAKQLETAGPSWSAWVGPDCVVCGGLQVDPTDDGRAVAWSWIAPGASAHMHELVKIIRKGLPRQGFRRVEYHVLLENRSGHKLARVLGFTVEAACMSSYTPEGHDVALYARIFK